MNTIKNSTPINEESIVSQIYIISGHKIMIDSDLAILYGVTTSRLNEQVKRNINRFPSDFMFQLTKEEFENLISQIATSSPTFSKASWGGRRKPPFVFTEHGTIMLALTAK